MENYSMVNRIQFILSGEDFTLARYMRQFELSRRTAFRDFDFVKNYKDYSLILDKKTGFYHLEKGNVCK